jgi:UDPglucose 6-dehydrogenase
MPLIAKHCPDYTVTVVDLDVSKIAAWNSDNLPIHEPGLLQIVLAQRGKNLFFSSDVNGATRDADMLFVCIPTPTKEYGRGAGYAYDMAFWESVGRNIAAVSVSNKIVVEKSTVPVTTAASLKQLLYNLSPHKDVQFEVLSNPEFLAEGTAVRDLEAPDRVLIGGDENTATGRAAIEELAKVYAHWIPRERIVSASSYSAELIKLASNSFLAMRISCINSIGMICEETHADIEQVSRGIGMDARLGPHFLKSSLGFGGSCFRKDILGMSYMAESLGLPEVAQFWRSAVDLNELRKNRFCDQVLRAMHGTLRNKKVVVLGMAFKAHTGDIRESPSLAVVKFLVEEKAKVHIFDPVVDAATILGAFPGVTVENTVLAAAEKATAIIVCTEWPQFREADWPAIFKVMLRPSKVFDGRLCLDKELMHSIGFELYRIGCSSMKTAE